MTKENMEIFFTASIMILLHFLPLILIIIASILIIKRVHKHNKSKLEIERYKAETERIKAEAMRDAAAARKDHTDQ